MSGSTEADHQLALRMSRRLVDRMDVGRQTRVALISFGDHATTHFNFNTYVTKSHVLSAINIIPSHGRTNTQARRRSCTLAAFSGKRNVTVWRSSVCLSVPSAYSQGAACDATSVHFGPSVRRTDILVQSFAALDCSVSIADWMSVSHRLSL